MSDRTLFDDDDSWTPSRPASVVLPRLPERYEVIGLIARGGQGAVWRAFDHKLERELAVKILANGASDARRRFRLETSLTVQFSHPGIIPVHDRGITADGQPWFAMKPVDGVELTEAIERAHARVGDDRWSLRRLIDALVRVCEAVAYAHGQGVVHRDLKPGNIMIGQFGEVWVMDWGLACRTGERGDARGAGGAPTAAPAAAAHPGVTRVGVVLGTPGYMAPEQARGEAHRIDRRADVYALGAILYAVLTGERPDGRPPADFLARPDLAPLAELVRAAMADEPDERPADAEAVRRAITDWLDGARDRQAALALVEQARALLPEIAAHRAEAERHARRAAALLEAVPSHAPEASKHPGWREERAAHDWRRRAARAELQLEQLARAALVRKPGLSEARRLLADQYRAALQRAESRRDLDGAARFEALLAEHDDGRYAGVLAGQGALTVITEPAEARIEVRRVIERDRRLVAEPTERVLRGPVRGRKIDRGSYVLRLEADGFEPVVYPVYIERGEAWTARAPGDAAPTPIRLPAAGALAPDERYVPAGWTILGGDPHAGDSLPRTRLWIDGFIMRRYPITVAEYRAVMGAAPNADAPDDHAVVSVSWRDAVAFADRLAEQSGLPWRLPHGLEWEKAARGVDGRLWPWGDHFDASRACTIEHFAGKPGPRPVGDSPADESPYGVADLVGGVREWCLDVYRRDPPEQPRLRITRPDVDDSAQRTGRGGAWNNRADTARPAGRFAGRPDLTARILGFRVVRSFG